MDEPHVIVMFGATGDLARRKLLPGLLHLFQTGLLPPGRIVGTSLEEHDREGFVAFTREAVREFSHRPLSEEQWDAFAAMLRYVPGSGGAAALRAAVEEAEAELDGESRRLHYLSVPPKAALAVVRLLDEAKLVERSRIVMEKPFGTDLASARTLNAALHEVFDEEQIFRIDHFLGKEAAQNILAFRFANGLFEPIWHRSHIDHVQIDVPEELGLSTRAEFYEATGAYRDMVVTHLFQVLAFMAMEPPTALEPRAISEEKNKVFRSMKPIDPANVVRGQYIGLPRDGRRGTGVRDRDLHRAQVRDRQLALGGGAVLPAHRQASGRGGADHLDRVQGATAQHVPARVRGGAERAGPPDLRPRRLRPGCRCRSTASGPGPGMKLDKVSMQFAMQDTGWAGSALEAYERLIRDAMRGDHTLFTSAEGIERLWELSTPLLDNPPPVRPYREGSWGPNAIHQLIAPHAWRLPFERAWRHPNVYGG